MEIEDIDKMIDNGENTCDRCGCKEDSEDLVWIDSEDFEPLERDEFNPSKHRKAIEEHEYSALCVECYEEECCGEE